MCRPIPGSRRAASTHRSSGTSYPLCDAGRAILPEGPRRARPTQTVRRRADEAPPRTAAGGTQLEPPRQAGCTIPIQVLGTVLRAPSSHGGRKPMATSAERMRALRERARRGIRRLTVDVSDGDLQAMVEHGYAGAASTEPRSAGASHQPFYHRHARQIGQLTAHDGCNAVSAATPSPMQRRFSPPKEAVEAVPPAGCGTPATP
jgi:hypothetical protein